jgi:TolB-like protein
VEALRDELEATLKNPVSIYFDENPHDGLLETHQVDASLAEKLKCLVFIPIISQTYCDEASFAWEHEFMPFINMAKEDELGMSITLSNGNVVSRVLPVKIHRLDIDDQNTLEAVLDGPLRSIDFIYQEPGVNRPLKTDDDRNLNLEKTDYHNQVNKVANALKDIGASVVKQADGKIRVPVAEKESHPPGKSSKKGIYIALASIVIALLMYWGYSQFFKLPIAEAEDITIAVLAFDDQSPDGDQEWLGDGMADEILNVLAKVEGLQVIGKTSSFSFKGKGLTTKVIGETLNVSTVLEGSVIKIGDKLRITAQLIDVETDTHIWSKRYDRDASDIFAIVDEVAQSIAGSLRSELSLEDLETIKVDQKVDPDAYEYYLKGFQIHWNQYIPTHNNTYFEQSEKMFFKAIAIDSNYVDAYAGLADLYLTKNYTILSTTENEQLASEYRKKRDSITNIGYKISPNSAYILMLKGSKFEDPGISNWDSAFFYYKLAQGLDPDNISINTMTADLF